MCFYYNNNDLIDARFEGPLRLLKNINGALWTNYQLVWSRMWDFLFVGCKDMNLAFFFPLFLSSDKNYIDMSY